MGLPMAHFRDSAYWLLIPLLVPAAFSGMNTGSVETVEEKV